MSTIEERLQADAARWQSQVDGAMLARTPASARDTSVAGPQDPHEIGDPQDPREIGDPQDPHEAGHPVRSPLRSPDGAGGSTPPHRRATGPRWVFPAAAAASVAALVIGALTVLGGGSTPTHPALSATRNQSTRPGPATKGSSVAPGPTSPAVLGAPGWSVLATRPGPLTLDPTLVWDGTELLAVGGTHRGVPTRAVAAYDPAHNTWRELAPIPGTVGADLAYAGWTGHHLIVLDAPDSSEGNGSGTVSTATNDARSTGSSSHVGALDPATGTWTVIDTPLPDGNQVVTPAGDDQVLVAVVAQPVLGPGTALTASAPIQGQIQAARLDLRTLTWTRIDPPRDGGDGYGLQGLRVLTVQDTVWLWAGSLHQQRESDGSTLATSSVRVWNLSPGDRPAWSERTVKATPSERGTFPDTTAVAGNRAYLISGSYLCTMAPCPAPQPKPVQELDPQRARLTRLPADPLAAYHENLIWTGTRLITLDPSGTTADRTGGSHTTSDVLAIWNPSTKRWTRGNPVPTALNNAVTPVAGGGALYTLTADGRLIRFLPAT